MPFGLCNAPATFQRMMFQVLAPLGWNMALVYLDDVIIFSKTLQAHCQHLDAVLQCLGDAGLRLKPKKCVFAARQVIYLGHLISEKGIQPDPGRVDQLAIYQRPTSIKELRSFLGFASYYRRFIQDFAGRADDLYSMIRTTEWVWTDACEHSFNNLRTALCDLPVQVHFHPVLPTIIQTDAS